MSRFPQCGFPHLRARRLPTRHRGLAAWCGKADVIVGRGDMSTIRLRTVHGVRYTSYSIGGKVRAAHAPARALSRRYGGLVNWVITQREGRNLVLPIAP